MKRVAGLALFAVLALATAAAASLSAPQNEYVIEDYFHADPRRETPIHARTRIYNVACRAGYTAVAGRVVRHDPDVVVVASAASISPGSWIFEVSNYSRWLTIVYVEVSCVKGAPVPPRYFLVLGSYVLQPRQVRKADVNGPRFVSPLGFSFRMRPLQGTDPPAGNSRVQILRAQPRARGYAFQFENTGSEPVRVQAGALFARGRAGRATSLTRLVSVSRSVPPGQWVFPSARCRPGSAAVASGWSFPGREIDHLASHAGRDFRFGVFNGADAARQVRFFGVCLKGQPTPAARPFNLGPNAVSAEGSFSNGQGGCPVATSFRDHFLFRARGNGMLTITQPKTEDEVNGPILPDGSFHLRSPGEAYDGKISGNRATATYSYKTTTGCTETYDVTFTLERTP